MVEFNQETVFKFQWEILFEFSSFTAFRLIFNSRLDLLNLCGEPTTNFSSYITLTLQAFNFEYELAYKLSLLLCFFLYLLFTLLLQFYILVWIFFFSILQLSNVIPFIGIFINEVYCSYSVININTSLIV